MWSCSRRNETGDNYPKHIYMQDFLTGRSAAVKVCAVSFVFMRVLLDTITRNAAALRGKIVLSEYL